jgi:ribonuclease P protein component
MFPRNFRFSLRSHPSIFRESKRLIGKTVELFAQQSSRETPQLAISIGKHVSTLSVVRNDIKRRVRTALLQEIKGLKNMTIVVRPRSAATHADYETITQDIRQLLSQLRH